MKQQPDADVLIETNDDTDDPFVHLSDVFKHISAFRRRGHQIGRKVGDMLEVLTLAAIVRDPELKRRLTLEPKLEGMSGAKHKVEFAIYALDKNGDQLKTIPALLSFIECKKVGVEQTVNSGFKKKYGSAKNIVPWGDTLNVNFNPRWLEGSYKFEIAFKGSKDPAVSVWQDGEEIDSSPISAGHRLAFGVKNNGESFFVGNSGSLRDVEGSIRLCKILEIETVADAGLGLMLNDCLSGPQTPEKAKQASFVALDIRKGRFGQFDKRPNEMECVSVLVLTEFAHWEQKSQNMIKASLDHNLVVDDKLVVDAIIAYEEKYGEGFLDKVTKEFFMASEPAKKIAVDLVEAKKGKIFRDIVDGKYKSIVYRGGHVVVE